MRRYPHLSQLRRPAGSVWLRGSAGGAAVIVVRKTRSADALGCPAT